MIEFIAVAIFIALVWYFLKLRKKKSADTGKNAPESIKPKPAPTKPVDKVEVAPTETVTAQAQVEVAPTPVQPVAVESKPVISQVTIEVENSLLPQDSMLRRHYLTHVRGMVTAISPARPTDSALARHYDAQIIADVEHYLSNEAAMQQLVAANAASQKALASVVAKSETVAPAVVTEEAVVEELQMAAEEPQIIIEDSEIPVVHIEIPVVRVAAPVVVAQQSTVSIPEDSMLKRHYITNLYAQVAATLSPRPTDSTLRRHYDSLLENAVNSQLNQ